ncbi:diaminohydroxyphosphoribosylaminopyrimidine reductase [Thermogymnomonas acidicola]|uniref:Diaminohydroxyphosphoribosylaminopyrimidine reductase n=1 Tax=Thermogymnomonas acidicola TaxID=399579 RepID=A0AA37BRV1_9ARCH|nr:dihydrofolate reductase family protein [Thermogymnomonas acidicola]GGM73674.1 diaminohydroxyphosphoribosylaminopyrimidine reductase [Thermogymnomonas acidicola]
MPSRPAVHVNMAMSLNGYISGPGGRRANISSDEDWKRVMQLRGSVDAIIVGVNTVISDDPELVPRGQGVPRLPVRAVIDPHLRTPAGSRITRGSARTIIFSERPGEVEGATVVHMPQGVSVRSVLSFMHSQGFRSVLLEGGRKTVSSFLREGVVDTFTLFLSYLVLPDGGTRLFSTDTEISGLVTSSRLMEGGVLLQIDPGAAARAIL